MFGVSPTSREGLTGREPPSSSTGEFTPVAALQTYQAHQMVRTTSDLINHYSSPVPTNTGTIIGHHSTR